MPLTLTPLPLACERVKQWNPPAHSRMFKVLEEKHHRWVNAKLGVHRDRHVQTRPRKLCFSSASIEVFILDLNVHHPVVVVLFFFARTRHGLNHPRALGPGSCAFLWSLITSSRILVASQPKSIFHDIYVVVFLAGKSIIYLLFERER